MLPSLSTRKALSSNSSTRWSRSVCFSALRRRLNAVRCFGEHAIRWRPVRRRPQAGHTTGPDGSPDATTTAPRVARSDCQSETASGIVESYRGVLRQFLAPMPVRYQAAPRPGIDQFITSRLSSPPVDPRFAVRSLPGEALCRARQRLPGRILRHSSSAHGIAIEVTPHTATW